MFTFSGMCCQNFLTPNSSQQFNINFQSGSVFNSTSIFNVGMMNSNCGFWGNNFGFGVNQFMRMPFMNPMIGFMNFFNPMSFINPMSDMWQFGQGMNFLNNSTQNDNNDTDSCTCCCNCGKDEECDTQTSETESSHISSSKPEVVSSDNNEQEPAQPIITVRKSRRQRRKERAAAIANIEQQTEEFKALPEKLKKDVIFVAEDALKKFLKKGSLKPSQVSPGNAEIFIKHIDIDPVYDVKFGTKNDYFDKNGDIVRVQDGTMLTITFAYEGKVYKFEKYEDKIARKLKRDSFVEKLSRGEEM